MTIKRKRTIIYLTGNIRSRNLTGGKEETMKYKIGIIRRQSKNNGINFCRYYVIADAATGEIVRDDNWNINSKYGKRGAEAALEKMEVAQCA